MRIIALCLGLLIATPAAANSVEDSLCGPASAPVARMAEWEKLCRASVRSLSTLPQSTSSELNALLTPENLATMAAVTSVWLGTQGVPVVGEAVDAALLTLGVALVAVQAGEVSNALWSFANRARTARTEADLKEAASSLAFAISKVGVNVVAFVLMKRVAGKVSRPRAPPNEPPPITPEGMFVTEGGAATAPARSAAPSAVASGVLSQSSGRPSSNEQASSPKKVDPKAFADWIARARKKPVEDDSVEAAYQLAHAGPAELEVSGGGVMIRADGARMSDALLLETKHIGSPDNSPYIPGSRCPETVRNMIRNSLVDQFQRYATIIRDPATPAVGLEVITNDARAVAFFEALRRETKTPGRVVVKH